MRRYGNLYVACEGDADKTFLDKLLGHHHIPGFDVGVAGGKDNWQTHFDAVRSSSDWAGLRGFIVVGDNNDDPPERFGKIREALQNTGFPAPTSPDQVIDGPPVVTVLMFPGADKKGCLETVLLDAVYQAHPTLKPCLAALQDCVPATKAWDESKQSKMRLHSAIAVSCQEDPSCSVRFVWGKGGNPIPIGSPMFNGLADFLRSFRERVLGS